MNGKNYRETTKTLCLLCLPDLDAVREEWCGAWRGAQVQEDRLEKKQRRHQKPALLATQVKEAGGDHPPVGLWSFKEESHQLLPPGCGVWASSGGLAT